MAFRAWNNEHLARFNSADASDFLTLYEDGVNAEILRANSEPSHRTFAPSSMRCDRISWFRLRGVEPDVPKSADVTLDFTAKLGTAIHRITQERLSSILGDDWIPVDKYLAEHPIPYKYTLTPSPDSLETQIELHDPPIRFACDGIIRVNKLYLLEIKTVEYASWNNLTDPKPQHIDQTNTYCTLMGLDRVMYLYIDRQYGGCKAYARDVPSNIKQNTMNRIHRVQKCAETNLAPDPLPIGDSWCTPAFCHYYKKCSEYGRW